MPDLGPLDLGQPSSVRRSSVLGPRTAVLGLQSSDSSPIILRTVEGQRPEAVLRYLAEDRGTRSEARYPRTSVPTSVLGYPVSGLGPTVLGLILVDRELIVDGYAAACRGQPGYTPCIYRGLPLVGCLDTRTRRVIDESSPGTSNGRTDEDVVRGGPVTARPSLAGGPPSAVTSIGQSPCSR